MLVNVGKRISSEMANASDSPVRRSLNVFGLRDAERSQTSEAGQLRLSAEAGKAAHDEEHSTEILEERR